MSAKNVAALLQLFVALLFSDLILLSKELFTAHSQLNFPHNTKKKKAEELKE